MKRRNDVIIVHETKSDSTALFLATRDIKEGLIFVTIMSAKNTGLIGENLMKGDLLLTLYSV